MRIFTRLFNLAAVAVIISAGNQPAEARTTGFDLADYVHKTIRNKPESARERLADIERINALINKNTAPAVPLLGGAAVPAEDLKPSTTFGPANTFSDLDGPDGELWFYTMNLENEAIQHEYFTEYILKSYTVTIYDSKLNLVGTIHDNMEYADDEVRVAGCNLLPSATRYFFNDDDNCEIVIGLAVNTSVPGINRYRSLAYQIGGEKESDGTDKVIATIPELVCNVLDASTTDNPGNIYMSTMSEYFPVDFPEDGDIWQYKLDSKVHLQVYGKADNNGKLNEVLTYDICHLNLPGDQENSPFMLTLSDNDKPYIVFSHYKETLFEPYHSNNEDMVQRVSNSLVIELFELGPTPVKIQETEIPFTKDSDEDVIGSFYSVGDLRYKDDVNFHDFDNSGKAAFYITKGNKIVGSDEILERSYYIYLHDGTLKSTVFEQSESTLALANLKGSEPQNMFITIRNNEYVFNFVDLISCRTVASISQYLKVDGSDPDPLLSNMDRVAYGDSYRYAIEMKYPSEEDDLAFMRVAWINADGTPDHIDEVNIGKGVQYAQCFIESNTLDPTTFHSDSNQEYLMLIKRGNEGGGTSEELLVGQARSEEYPDGRDLLYLTPGEKGYINTVLPYSMAGLPMLAVIYNTGTSGFTIDYYTLPFDGNQSGIVPTISGTQENATITFDGTTAIAEGFTIELYSIQGILIASAPDKLDISIFPAGTYIIKAGNNAKKIIR